MAGAVDTCPECDGLGRVPVLVLDVVRGEATQPCPVCRGGGRRPVYWPSSWSSPWQRTGVSPDQWRRVSAPRP